MQSTLCIIADKNLQLEQKYFYSYEDGLKSSYDVDVFLFFLPMGSKHCNTKGRSE